MKLIFLFLLISTAGFSQSNTGILHPSESLTNRSSDTLFYMPKQNLELLMHREEQKLELISTLEQHASVCDSALALKTIETETWYTKLLETDAQLRDAEIVLLKKKKQNRRWNKVWFGAGVVLGWVVFGFF